MVLTRPKTSIIHAAAGLAAAGKPSLLPSGTFSPTSWPYQVSISALRRVRFFYISMCVTGLGPPTQHGGGRLPLQWTIVEAVTARRHGAARGGVCVLIDGAMFVCSDRKKDVTAARLSLAFPVRFNPAICANRSYSAWCVRDSSYANLISHTHTHSGLVLVLVLEKNETENSVTDLRRNSAEMWHHGLCSRSGNFLSVKNPDMPG